MPPSWHKLVLAALIAVALTGAMFLDWPALLADEQHLAALLATRGPLGLLAFFALGAAFTAVGGPRQALALAAGYALGPWRGILLSLVATVAGAALCFGIASLAPRHLLEKRFPRQLARLDAFLGPRIWLKIVALRFAPVGSNFLTNALAGALHLKPAPFLIGSAIGYLPQTFAFALVGAGMAPADSWHIWAGIALFLLAAAASYPLRKHHALPRAAP